MCVVPIASVPVRHVAGRRIAVGILLAVCCTATRVLAQRTHVVYGTVVDAGSAALIPYAEIWLVHDDSILTNEYSTTTTDGRFMVRAGGTGRFALYARRIGYSPVVTPLGELSDLDSLSVSIRMAPVAISLPQAIVTGRNELRDILLSGFDHRRALGLGAFITYDEIQRKGAPALAELLREIPGVNVRGVGARVEVQMGRSSLMRRCEPLIYMDGQRATHSTDPPSVVGELIAGTPGPALEAVEVYRGRSELPAEFADPDALCGAIVIWTRRPALHERAPEKHPSPPL